MGELDGMRTTPCTSHFLATPPRSSYGVASAVKVRQMLGQYTIARVQAARLVQAV
ncbi:hypothetical protein E2C01_094476 [Portunus trituberculatus]|uniref:Uncharacterized protein n=1 Tax=Portunus trituberculatus TaxID=210409 RepID=A0A5B7JM83_PORTR|nr:hypothetical protein [Portunus trituberculatus]